MANHHQGNLLPQPQPHAHHAFGPPMYQPPGVAPPMAPPAGGALPNAGAPYMGAPPRALPFGGHHLQLCGDRDGILGRFRKDCPASVQELPDWIEKVLNAMRQARSGIRWVGTYFPFPGAPPVRSTWVPCVQKAVTAGVGGTV